MEKDSYRSTEGVHREVHLTSTATSHKIIKRTFCWEKQINRFFSDSSDLCLKTHWVSGRENRLEAAATADDVGGEMKKLRVFLEDLTSLKLRLSGRFWAKKTKKCCLTAELRPKSSTDINDTPWTNVRVWFNQRKVGGAGLNINLLYSQ